jgi:hypothetical protein
MLYETIPDDLEPKKAAMKIARRNMELVAAASAAGALASWISIRTRFPALGPVMPAALCGFLGLFMVGGALLLRRWPRASFVDAIARQLPKTGRRMLSRPAVAGMAVFSLVFAWCVGLAMAPAAPAAGDPPARGQSGTRR